MSAMNGGPLSILTYDGLSSTPEEPIALLLSAMDLTFSNLEVLARCTRAWVNHMHAHSIGQMLLVVILADKPSVYAPRYLSVTGVIL
jgi:hypothetical protein